ncbi:alpha-hydroxy-acid oxidizing protein [Kitasatospora sp. NBC_01287]|uniref:alpha-hydroxy acid oxidase n=1 Tax=Kitasatospora sp. NBC_01287 TaxID=2903573 RepID=UPI00224CD98F|nr:alpha-hydroxy acid oxidase [Kitasatospora sp. NBC_01287]MCX4744978.1 alpha-hydroxy-acid oxidizing protein [Kitasatospora sp. NBC_01287]
MSADSANARSANTQPVDAQPASTQPAKAPWASAAALCLAEVEARARAVLPPEVWDFVAGGSGSESSLRANRAALDEVFLAPRMLRDVTARSTAARLLGAQAALPLAVAPVAYHRLAHPEGELAVARAAAKAGVPFTAATLSSYPIERITATGATTWFQLYWLRDPGHRLELIRRAEAAGCTALVLTVDVPWMGRRLRDVRNGFALPAGVVAANLTEATDSAAHRGAAGGSAVATHTALAFAPDLTWADVEQLRATTRLPIVLKGLLDPADAVLAARAGAAAVVVSNHGGRQLDGAVPAVQLVGEVREAVGGAVGDACQVLLDGGIRSGLDVLRALARGADGVLVGRPLIWGLAADGEAGAHRVLDLLATEFDDALGLAGCLSPAEARSLRTVIRPHRLESP